jgi:hypothetical protein
VMPGGSYASLSIESPQPDANRSAFLPQVESKRFGRRVATAGTIALATFALSALLSSPSRSSETGEAPSKEAWWPGLHPAPAPTTARSYCPPAFCNSCVLGLSEVALPATTLSSYCDGAAGNYTAMLDSVDGRTRSRCMAETLCSTNVLDDAGEKLLADLIGTLHETFEWTPGDSGKKIDDEDNDDDCVRTCQVINSQSQRYRLMGAHTCSELYDDDDYD